MFDKKAYQQHYYLETKEKYKEYHRRANKELKVKTLLHYSPIDSLKCSRCGIDDIDVLCLDHINGGGSEQRRRLNIGHGSNFYSWLKRNNYPSGYQVLCFNCNMKKRIIEGL